MKHQFLTGAEKEKQTTQGQEEAAGRYNFWGRKETSVCWLAFVSLSRPNVQIGRRETSPERWGYSSAWTDRAEKSERLWNRELPRMPAGH